MDEKCPDNCFSAFVLLKQWQRFTLAGGLSVINALALLSNVAVINGIFRTNQKNNVFCTLVLFLSSSDCLLAFTNQTSVVVVILKPKINCIFQMSAQFIAVLFFSLSGYIIIATAFDKMVNINQRRLPHRSIFMKHAYIVGLICLVLAFLTASAYTLITLYGVFNYFHPIMLIIVIICVVAIFLSYMTVYRRVHHHVKATPNLRNPNISNISGTQSLPVYCSSSTRVIRRILIAVFIAYIPNVAVSLYWYYYWINYHPKHITAWLTFAMYLSYFLTYFNSTLNAVIFILGNKKVKRFLTRIWWGRK